MMIKVNKIYIGSYIWGGDKSTFIKTHLWHRMQIWWCHNVSAMNKNHKIGTYERYEKLALEIIFEAFLHLTKKTIGQIPTVAELVWMVPRVLRMKVELASDMWQQ